MVHKYENDVLVECNECLLLIERNLEKKTQFPITAFRNEYLECRKETLWFIIGKLCSLERNGWEWPKRTRERITEKLTNHGQFSTEEIDETFEEWSQLTNSYSLEYLEEHPEINEKLAWDAALPHRRKKIVEKTYRFPITSCGYRKWIGYCPIDIEHVFCPDCANFTTNTPENITLGLYNALLCSNCGLRTNDPFDVRGLLRVSGIMHHGHWDTQEPELVYTGTDYFIVYHPKCEKSNREDGKGVMLVEGIYVDDSGRIVLGLKCNDCGARNALKPHKLSKETILLNESGAIWKSIASEVEELIGMGEGQHLEFKSSLSYDYGTGKRNKDLEYTVAHSIAAFMNSDGGKLLIGVSDFGIVLGLEQDFMLMTKGEIEKGRDRFGVRLNEVINQYIGRGLRDIIRNTPDFIKDREICVIDVEPAAKPIFFEKDKYRFLPSRAGPQINNLVGDAMAEYIQRIWPDYNMV